MTQIAPSSVTRTIDRSGTEIKAFLDDQNTFIQAIALVDDKGNQIAVSGNPLYITITGSSVVTLDSGTIDTLTGSIINVGITGTPTFQLNDDSISQLTGSITTVNLSGDTISTITSSLSSINLNVETISNLTSSTAVVESRSIGEYGQQIGLSSSPVWTSITGNKDTQLVDMSGRLDVAQSETYTLFSDILKELKKINLQMSLMTDTHITNQDVEV